MLKSKFKALKMAISIILRFADRLAEPKFFSIRPVPDALEVPDKVTFSKYINYQLDSLIQRRCKFRFTMLNTKLHNFNKITR